MVPLGELRLSIPVGIFFYNLNIFLVFFLSVIGNLIPVILLLLFLGPILSWVSRKNKLCERILGEIFKKTRNKYNSSIQKYGFWALAIFAAIPLPLTGGWTASLATFLFDISFKKAFFSISLGITVAGLIMVTAIKAGIAIEEFYGMQVLLGIITVLVLFWIMLKILKNKKNV